MYFNSRPHGGRRPRLSLLGHVSYFNSRPHGGRRNAALTIVGNCDISTHALTEGDYFGYMAVLSQLYFNSRPHGGRRKRHGDVETLYAFQLTPSRRATVGISRQHRRERFQLTPSRRATIKFTSAQNSDLFQLTPSRRATSRCRISRSTKNISTHALTEGDIFLRRICVRIKYFNSRPHGGRPLGSTWKRNIKSISTHALTEGDRRCDYVRGQQIISTHALTEGDDERPIYSEFF